jgi:hypothetical protein
MCERVAWDLVVYVVYYETINRELKRRLIYEYRCDERQKTKKEESTPHRHWVGRGTGIPKDKDEVNRREVFECETSMR